MRLVRYIFSAGLTLAMASTPGWSQASLLGAPNRSVEKAQAVEYLFPEQVTVPSGRPTAVALHFRIAQGLHINSHSPKDEFLIPTNLSFPDGSGVQLAATAYPAGVDYVLPADPRTKLNVYAGEFTIETKMVAAHGDHLVEAKLRYQACDQTQCMPPKTITVPIDVVGN